MGRYIYWKETLDWYKKFREWFGYVGIARILTREEYAETAFSAGFYAGERFEKNRIKEIL